MKTVDMKPVFLIYGEDEFPVSTRTHQLIDQLMSPDEKTMGLEMIDGKADNSSVAIKILRQCLEAIRTIGFLNGRKVVWLRGATFFDQGVVARSKDVQETVSALTTFITSGIPAGHTLIVTAPAVYKKSGFYQACQRAGEIITFAMPKAWNRDSSAVQYARTAFQKYGLRARENVISAFAQKVGTNTRQLDQETNKLSVFLAPRQDVYHDDLELIVSASRDMFVWDIEDSVATGQLARSIKILRQLTFQKEPPIRLLMRLDRLFRNLLVFREAIDNRWITLNTNANQHPHTGHEKSPGNMNQLFSQALSSGKGRMPAFVEKKLTEQAKTFSRDSLFKSQELILETRQKLVSSKIPPLILLEILIIKLCGKP